MKISKEQLFHNQNTFYASHQELNVRNVGMSFHSCGYSYFLRRHRSTPAKCIKIKSEPIENIDCNSILPKESVAESKSKENRQMYAEVVKEVQVPATSEQGECVINVKQELAEEDRSVASENLENLEGFAPFSIESSVDSQRQDVEMDAEITNENMTPKNIDDLNVVEPMSGNEQQRNIEKINQLMVYEKPQKPQDQIEREDGVHVTGLEDLFYSIKSTEQPKIELIHSSSDACIEGVELNSGFIIEEISGDPQYLIEASEDDKSVILLDCGSISPKPIQDVKLEPESMDDYLISTTEHVSNDSHEEDILVNHGLSAIKKSDILQDQLGGCEIEKSVMDGGGISPNQTERIKVERKSVDELNEAALIPKEEKLKQSQTGIDESPIILLVENPFAVDSLKWKRKKERMKNKKKKEESCIESIYQCSPGDENRTATNATAPEKIHEYRKEPSTNTTSDLSNIQNDIGCRNDTPANATIVFENNVQESVNHNTTKTCEIGIKMERPTADLDETISSEVNVSINEPICCSIKQEYLEMASLHIPDVKEGTDINIEPSQVFEDVYVNTPPMNIELGQVAREVYINTEYPTDIKPCSFSYIELPLSQEENLLIPSHQSVSKENTAKTTRKRKNNLKHKVGGAKRKTVSDMKSRSSLTKGRNKKCTKRRNKIFDSCPRFKYHVSKIKYDGAEKRTTRHNTQKQKIKNFPKPLQSKDVPHKVRQTNIDIATELPRPMVFKLESEPFNTKKPQTYSIRALQPRVRLKRLTGHPFTVVKAENRTHNCKCTSLWNSNTCRDKREHILIQNAFSLNPCNRKTDAEAYHGPNSNRSFTPNTSNQSQYYRHQEFVQSTTPGSESTATSINCDSGVSTSSPRGRDNQTILLEIAAERAFINNHLIRFGYSPIQFELYNDINDLCIFLKYLFGRLNVNHE